MTDEEREKRDQVKRDNFKRIIERRAPVVLKAIDMIGHLANRGSYIFTPEQINGVFDMFQERLDKVRAQFEPPVAKTKEPAPVFKLDDVTAAPATECATGPADSMLAVPDALAGDPAHLEGAE